MICAEFGSGAVPEVTSGLLFCCCERSPIKSGTTGGGIVCPALPLGLGLVSEYLKNIEASGVVGWILRIFVFLTIRLAIIFWPVTLVAGLFVYWRYF